MLLDAAATGVNTVEREGISHSHEAKFVLVGTMNPEEGELRPQLLDRFGLVVDIVGENEIDVRVKIMENRLMYEENPEVFLKKYSRANGVLRRKILKAREILPEVCISREMLKKIAEIGIFYGTEGHRFDISMVKVSKAMVAMAGRKEVKKEDLSKAAKYTLPHRTKVVQSSKEQGRKPESIQTTVENMLNEGDVDEKKEDG